MGPLRKRKGGGAGGGKTEALLAPPGKELPDCVTSADSLDNNNKNNNPPRSFTMSGRKESVTKPSAASASESCNSLSRSGRSLCVLSNHRKSENCCLFSHMQSGWLTICGLFFLSLTG
jgi:hypothetical protein